MMIRVNQERALMLSEALTQFVENANDPEERSAREAHNIELAMALLDEIDGEIAC